MCPFLTLFPQNVRTTTVCIKHLRHWKQTVQFMFVSNACTKKCSHHAGTAGSLRALHYQHNNRRVWMDIGGVERKVSKNRRACYWSGTTENLQTFASIDIWFCEWEILSYWKWVRPLEGIFTVQIYASQPWGQSNMQDVWKRLEK